MSENAKPTETTEERAEQDRFAIRELRGSDLAAIVQTDAEHTGVAKDDFWAASVARVLENPGTNLGFVACNGDEIVGFILAEARTWEFGSPLCGWITAVGVKRGYKRRGVAFALCREVCATFRGSGIRNVRTMVRRDDVDVLSFFRAAGFRAGPFIELDLEIEP